MSDAATTVWAKSSRSDGTWLPLWRHLDDSAAMAGRLWDEWLPESVKRLIHEPMPGGDGAGRALVRWLAGVHDIGKATPAFASKVQDLARPMTEAGLEVPVAIPYADRKLTLHATTGQVLLEQWLADTHGWEGGVARQFGIVVGGHHGVPPTDQDLAQAAQRRRLLGMTVKQEVWRAVQRELLDRAARTCDVADRLSDWGRVRLPQPVQVLVTAVVIVADWIASNEEYFSYEFASLYAPSRVDDAWDQLDLPAQWQAVASAGAPAELFADRFALPAGAVMRPVQAAAVRTAAAMPAAGLLVIEAPMGEGKTEAALAAAELLAHRTGAGGCFVALPTRATSDAMFKRVLSWLARVPDRDRERGALSVMLAHGKARFDEDYQRLMRRGRSSNIDVDGEEVQRSHARGPGEARVVRQDIAAHGWLAGRKRAMLSSFVVGTVDQLLFGALRSRHLALRHLGLAGKVVIIDEAHAYDVYMGQYLDRVLEWLAAYRVPTIVLSATLSSQRRAAMLEAYDRGRAGPAPAPVRRAWRQAVAEAAGQVAADAPADPYAAVAGDIGYPVLTATGPGGAPLVEVTEPSGREVTISLEAVDDEPATLARLLRTSLSSGGCALVVRNTVRRVQETAGHLRIALAGTGIDVSVAHSRFLLPDRAAKDAWLREAFGPPGDDGTAPGRPAAHVVVASQVAEQSLDIDFDLLVTDLAPVDLVLQRMGRLHRHLRGKGQSHRPPALRRARCVITGVDWTRTPPEPVAGSRLVYGVYLLLRSLMVLQPHLVGGRDVRLPVDISPLVQGAYADPPAGGWTDAAVDAGPAEWRSALDEAYRKHLKEQEDKEHRARSFRLGAVASDGTPIVAWLEAGVGDADEDDRRGTGRAQVRDTRAESVEVLVLVSRADGALITPPWLARDGGREVSTEHIPPGWLAKIVATCALSLPYALSTLPAVEELERRYWYPAWQESGWLAEQLVLVLDEQHTAELAGHHLHYDPFNGLEVTRIE